MAIFRWPDGFDPVSGLRLMQREMERLWSRSSEMFGNMQRIGGGAFPPVNVLNSPEDMVVQCELAGVKKEDLDISITGETLVIKGVKEPPDDEEKFHYQRRERGAGEFSRTIVLPDKVDPEKVEASLAAGILTIRLPKSEAAKPRQVAVK